MLTEYCNGLLYLGLGEADYIPGVVRALVTLTRDNMQSVLTTLQHFISFLWPKLHPLGVCHTNIFALLQEFIAANCRHEQMDLVLEDFMRRLNCMFHCLGNSFTKYV